MIDCREGDVVLVPFPFTDLATTKQRPALVLSVVVSQSYPKIFVVTMITSQMESEKLPGDCPISEWSAAGLIHRSKIRLAKIVSLEEGLLKKRLGSLLKADRAGVKKEFHRLFSFRDF